MSGLGFGFMSGLPKNLAIPAACPFALVVGDPVEHSRSPVIHGTAYQELGLKWDFVKHQLSAGQLGHFLDKLRTQPGFEDGTACRGLAVTMPLKPEALTAATYVDGLAKVTGAVNTLVPAIGEWAGFNTDVAGIVGAFRHAGFDDAQTKSFTAVILGSGATAASGLAALRELGATRLVIVSRQPQATGRAFAAAQRMRLPVTAVTWQDTAGLASVLEQATLILSTVPAGAQEKLPLPQVANRAIVLDAVYDPWPSPVVTWARGCGASIVPGWEMLIYQGVAQVKLFTGREVNPAAIRPALLDSIPNSGI
ncbi:shikimate dehydrogenase family protein [Mobiluncus mulieris]|uniref:Shikimate dehydrogenase n=1 Tax=Mobiluncus mulieris TaxID=2052 RepID=A0ABD4TTD0_9ACTO|nr:shikimate dehydrogenase [Mobiluncus mulieris]MCU9972333.1 shikimate dehydrogenase [Mobiluncus mulieris]NMW74520.1 shikimate dehydrogenase [Mobiluncus mulieris]NMX19124.1 shikimate dehydrogenase [Mobiluncus mulieris]